MRKIIVVLVLVVAIIGGYTAYWFRKADDFKHMLEQSITAVNEQAKALGGKDTLLRYTSIETSGYPFAMTLQVEKPILDFPVSAFLQNLPHPTGISPPATPPFEWVEEISYGDSVSFSGNITGNRFTLIVAGDRTHKSLVDHAARYTLAGTSSTPFICHLAVENMGTTPWTMQPLFTDLQTFLAIFRSVDCAVEGMALKDAESGAPLISSDGFSIAASNEATDGANHKLAFRTEAKNLKATPAFDAIVNSYMLMAYTLTGTPANQRMAMTPASIYGNQNLKVDMAYEGPAEGTSLADPAMHFRFDVNAFDVKSDIFDMGDETHVLSNPAGINRNASVSMHSHFEVSERYDQIIAKQFAAVFTQMKQSEGKTGPQAQVAQIMMRLGTPEEVAASVLPKFHNFGKITFDVDAKAEGPNRPREFFSRGNYTLGALNWIATPYGIKLKGSSNMSVPNKMPSGELVATCLTCDALVTDLGDYAMRIETLMGRAQDPVQPPRITRELVEGIRQFLHGIAENSTAKDLVIHLLMKDTGEFTVSGKQIPEVMGLFAQTIAPHLPPPQPAASAPVPAQPAPPSGN